MEDTRNVIDYYKYWETDAITADLDTKRHNFSILASNLSYDFNIGSVIRNANAFLAQEVILYGRKQYDRRGTIGTHHYTHFRHVREAQDIAEIVCDSVLVAVDNLDHAESLDTFIWPDKHVIIAFGQEQIGLPDEILDLADHLVYIQQFGSIRSLNVGCASGIVMYDYCNKRVL